MSTAPSTLVVCHDAGGAQIVAAYIAEFADQSPFLCCVAGPATAIFKHFKIPILELSAGDTPEKILAASPQVTRLLTGSSWSTALELDFIAAAKLKKIHTILYLDHWLNFRERFGYPHPGWSNRLPDEFWVGDEHAYEIAAKLFPNISITLEPNRYFGHLKLWASAAAFKNPVEANRVLWISEPFSESINPFGDTGKYPVTEFETLSSLIEILAACPRPLRLVVRLHPSEKPDKYTNLLQQAPKNLSWSVSEEPELLNDISRAQYVVGLESMALVIAMLAGKPVASFVPSAKYQCLLPFPLIKKLHTASELTAFLAV